MTKLEAIKELATYDHCFLGKEGVEELTKPFGFKGSTYLAKANPQDFKGLSLHDEKGNPVDEMEGQDSASVACQITYHLGVKYQEMFGRGSRLRSACEAVEKHLTK